MEAPVGKPNRNISLEALKYHWEGLAKDDEMFAIMAWENKRGHGWNPDDFFNTGQYDIDHYFRDFALRNCPDMNQTRALDFGCGIGRLTIPLSAYFEQMVGVDISHTMIETANKLGRTTKCLYLLNEQDSLRLFGSESFDHVFTLIVLQHMVPAMQKAYLKEFARILRHKGTLFFQLPGVMPGQDLPREELFGKPRMDMYGIAYEEVLGELKANGLEVLATGENNCVGPDLKSYHYLARKP